MDEVINLLNELNTIDPLATFNLMENRVYCKNELVNHPTIVVVGSGTVNQLGVLGLLNGLFEPINGRGQITAVYDDDRIVRFEKTS